MKYIYCFVLAYSLLAGPDGLGQDQPQPVSMIQLIANPEKLEGKLVAVEGFLILGDHPRPDFVGQQPNLYLHREDAENLLVSRSVWGRSDAA